MKTRLKQIREELNITQVEAASLLGISRRSYQTYENNDDYQNTDKYKFFFNKLLTILEDENQGILTIKQITDRCQNVFAKYDVSYCYLFGSYAKGKATQKSDIDLLVATSVSGLKFFGMVEELRTSLHKKVDVLELSQLDRNKDLLNEILKDGIRIYR